MRKINLRLLVGVVGTTAAIVGIGAISAPAQASPVNTNSNGAQAAPQAKMVGGYRSTLRVNVKNIEGTFVVPKPELVCVDSNSAYIGVKAVDTGQFSGVRVNCVNNQRANYRAVWAGSDGVIRPLDNNPALFQVKAGDRIVAQVRKTEPDVVQVRLLNWANWAESRFSGTSLGKTAAWGLWRTRGVSPILISPLRFTATKVNGNSAKSPAGKISNDYGYITSNTTGGGANFSIRQAIEENTFARQANSAGALNSSTPPPGGIGDAAISLGYATLVTPTKTKLDTQLPVGKTPCNLKKPGSYGTTVWVGDLANHNVSVKTNCVARLVRGKIKNTVINTGYINGKAFSRLDAGAVIVIKDGWVKIQPAPGKAQSTQVWATNELAVNSHLYTLEGHLSGYVTSVSGWVELPVQKQNTFESGRNARLTRDQHFGHLKLGA